ncbi:BON domain protein [Lyngbya aestuarii BL J]|uniref:BON domain protein n=1 Tax=Lyngbya aestuarii BL J TaxID=1348334 RepID=U7QE61_9CYAN|nr:BON domain-containing protein [Lyngbya aestuarii]ERT05335.1 BON domain protein [Lyngbya aestuarii BL J]
MDFYLLLGIVAVGFLVYLLMQRQRLFYSAVTVLGILLITFTQSSSALATPLLGALGTPDSVLQTPQQKQLDERLKLNPGGGQYSGVEYVKKDWKRTKALSDRQIKKTIKSDIQEDLVAMVANGSVILSGTVKDKNTARKIVKEVKAIPGVHEITFELGLKEKSNL